ncbi:uncharacterized protein [Littorina saxatilis]|uniref:uncharacterized protein n=1 Tax=Littorina saxatilis TaxID=31220 RepID=UPI0038B4791D
MATEAGLQEDEDSKTETQPPVKENTLKLKDDDSEKSNTEHSTDKNEENCTLDRKQHPEHSDSDEEKSDKMQENMDNDEVEENCDETQAGKDIPDPLRVDWFERLQLQAKGDGQKDWESYNACQDLRKVCRKLSCSERQFYAILMSVFAAMTFAMVFGLFVLQAQITMSSHEILTQVASVKKEMPQGMYSLYYDYLDSGIMPDKVDLRANTSIFVH